MDSQPPLSKAELVDRILQKSALMMSLLAAQLLASAIGQLVSETAASYFEIAETILTIAMLIPGIPLIILVVKKQVRIRQGEKFEVEGYLVDVFRRSCVLSWGITFCFIFVMAAVITKFFPDVPIKAVLVMLVGVMMGTMSVTFFILNRSDDSASEEAEDL